jgi:hypothetical protein
MSIDVTTRGYDFARTGANTAETVLTPAAVKTQGVTILQTLTVDDPRLDAQPLYVSGLTVQGKVRNVIYQATMANSVYAWDADTGQQLWKTNLGAPINGAKAIVNGDNKIDSHNINVDWGILSTPVIDRAANTLYACAWISDDNSATWQTGHHKLAALDLVTGALKHPSLSLEGTTYTPGHGLALQQFNSRERKQRSALAMTGGAVIICFGTIMEDDQIARGWVIAVDTGKWAIGAAWCSTARGYGGGIWMSGAGPAIQSDGSIWVVTGNGDFDGITDFSESVIRLKYNPAGASPASIQVTGWWTPWTDSGRTGGSPQGEGAKVQAKSLKQGDRPRASNFRLIPHLVRLGINPEAMNNPWGDQDLGASGIVLIEQHGIALVSGKDGVLYTINLANPGNTSPADLAVTSAAANYARLAAPPILYTFYDPTINPATTNPAGLNRLSGGKTHHLHGTPIFWQSATDGPLHFCGGENGNLRAWSLTANKSSSYLACSAEVASADLGPPGGMPGWSITLSANGSAAGIVWAMIPYGDANMHLTNGRLLAYDAADFAKYADGSGEIVPLWDSQTWGWNFLHPKFNRPIAVNGKVIVPTYDGRVLVLGLA